MDMRVGLDALPCRRSSEIGMQARVQPGGEACSLLGHLSDRRWVEPGPGQVDEAFAQGTTVTTDWVYWLNQEEVQFMAGRCYTELKRPGRAEPLLRRAIQRYDQTLVRENPRISAGSSSPTFSQGRSTRQQHSANAPREPGAHAGSALARKATACGTLLSSYK